MGRRVGTISESVSINGRYRIWYGIRALVRFTIPELQANSEAGRDNIAHYLRGLVRYGYVRVARSRRSGRKGGHALYQLVRNTGPNPPRLGGRGLYDPNTKELIGGGGDGSGVDAGAQNGVQAK